MNDNLVKSKVSCPICEKKFMSMKVKKTSQRIEKRDTDLCIYYKTENPYFYDINVCPECGFSFSNSFTRELGRETREKYINMMGNKWTGKDYCGERDLEKAIETYKLALASAQSIDAKSSILAGLCLRLCWLNRMMGNPKEEERFMKWSLLFYEKAYEYEDLGSEGMLSPEILVYLLGELSYRLKQYSDASKWFNLAISKYAQNASSDRNIAMIRDRWMDIRGEIKQKTL